MRRVALSIGRVVSALAGLAVGLVAQAAQAQVKISQVWGGGNVANGIYTVDYVELFNTGSTPVDVSSWSVQTSSQTLTTSSWHRINLTGIIPPGQFYLVQAHTVAAGAVGIPLPTPDAVSTGSASSFGLNISSSFSGVALVRNQTTFASGCPLGNPDIEDYFRYHDPAGNGAGNCFEGAAAGPAPLDFQRAVYRKGGGCTDTNNNFGDLEVLPANPRNSTVNGWISSAFAPDRFVSSVGGSATLSVSRTTIACNGLGTLQSATADLTQLAGPAAQPLTPDGSGGYTLLVPIPVGLPAGTLSIPITITASGMATVNTRAFVTIADTPPANDDCAAAIDLTSAGGSFVGTIDNRGAGSDVPTGACAAGIPSNSGVWFTYTPATTQILSLSETSTQNVKYGLFTGSCGSLVSAACSNSEGNETNPQARFRLVGGVQYFILVAHEPGYPPAIAMNLSISASAAPAAPGNDSCATAETIASFPLVASVNAEGALDDSVRPTCAIAGGTVARHGIWYSFTTTGPGRLQFLENNPNHAPSFGIYSGSCGALTPVSCGSAAADVPAAGNYFLQVYMNNNGLAPNGTFDFDIRFSPTPSNDTCANATDLSASSFPIQVNQSILAASDDADIGCNSGTTSFGRAVWFRFTAPIAGTFSISNANQPTTGTIAYAWYDACGGPEAGCGGGSSTTTRFIPLLQNQTILIAVGEWLRTSGERTDPIIIDFNFQPFAANITCATAEDLNVTGLPVNRSYDQTNAPDLATPNTCSPGSLGRRAVWFKYTPAVNGRLRVSDSQATQNADFRVFIPSGSPACDTLVDFACISDANDRGSFTIAAGQTYFIAVNDGGASPTGPAPYILTFELIPSPAANDLCSGAELISSLPFSASVTNVNAFGDDPDISCNALSTFGAMHGVWYRFVAPQDMAVTISETTSTLTAAAVYTSCGGAELACRNAEDHYFELAAGQQYYFLLAYDGSTSPLGPTATNTYSVAIYQVDRFTNDTCATARQVNSSTFSARVNLEMATPDTPAANITGCNPTSATQMRNTAWYKLVVTGTGNLIGTINPDFGNSADGLFSIYGTTDGTCAGIIPTPLQCDDTPEPLNVGQGVNPSVTLLAGQTYFLQVGKFGTSTTTLAGVSDIALFFTGTLQSPCAADFNGVGGLDVQDIFDFLNAWFASLPSADFNGINGIDVGDIFDFLNAWFAGCP